MFFFPLIETVTYTCHYMIDRLERFDLKTSKKTPSSWMPLGCELSKYFKVNYPFNIFVETIRFLFVCLFSRFFEI